MKDWAAGVENNRVEIIQILRVVFQLLLVSASVTPTSALTAAARPRSAPSVTVARREVVCRVMRRILLAIARAAATLVAPPFLSAGQHQGAPQKVNVSFR